MRQVRLDALQYAPAALNMKSAGVNRRSPIPLYYQVAEFIKSEIDASRLKPGDQLPPEREISARFGVSRMTARQALAYLGKQGTLVSQQGVGTFVAEPKLIHGTFHLQGFTEEMMHLGGLVHSRVLENIVCKPPSPIANKLGIDPDRTTVKILRLRLLGDVPLLLETSYLPTDVCPGLETEDLEKSSLYALLESHYGLFLDHARQTIEATAANDYEAQLMGVGIGTPMILLEGVTYATQKRPIEYVKGIYRGDRFKFELLSQRQASDDKNGISEMRVRII